VGVRVVDLRGKYVLPGLWDLHAHTEDLPKILLPLWVANGVTGVREMWGMPHLQPMRDRIEAGELLGPRMVVASKMIDGPIAVNTDPASTAVVRTPEEARAAVREAKRDGADFVKFWSLLTPELFEAITDEADQQGLPFAGHLPDRVPVVDGSRRGMRTMEHLHGIPLDVSSRRDELRARIASMQVDPENPAGFYFDVRALEMEAIAAYDPRRAERLFSVLQRNRSRLTPTLTVQRFFTFPPEVHRADPRARYMPPWVIERWNAGLGPDWTPEMVAQRQAYYEAVLRLVGEIADAGVTQVAGTDGGSLLPYVFAGFGLHDELGWLVDGGLTPMQAIVAATRDAARVVGLERRSGTVQPGKWADLLVVDADPLADIRNTQRIHAVVTRGRLITRAEREQMLADVEAEAQVTPEQPSPVATAAAGCCGVHTLHRPASPGRHP
jgi:cytosine/adenosine deaminase-related metal-dependent hydrolase